MMFSSPSNQVDDGSVVVVDNNKNKQVDEVKNQNNNDGIDGEEEQEEDFRETERFKVWRKHTRDVYKTCLHFEPAWPCRTIQFLPFMKQGSAADASNSDSNTNNNMMASSSSNKSRASALESMGQYQKVQTLLTGSITGGAEQNFLKLLNLSLPGGSGNRSPFSGTDGAELNKESGEVGGYGFAPEYVDFSVAARFFHDGDVLKARHMPSNPNVYLTASSTGKCYLFDYATMSMSTAANKSKRPKLPPAPVFVANRKEYELAQAHYRKINKEQEHWDRNIKGEGQHRVVLNPIFSSANNHVAASSSHLTTSSSAGVAIPTSCEFNFLKPAGVVCAGFDNGAILQWNLSDPPSQQQQQEQQKKDEQQLQQLQQKKMTTFAQSQKKLELDPACTRWCRDPVTGQNAGVTEVAFSYQDEHVMASSSLDGLARIWDLRSNPEHEAQCIFRCNSVGGGSFVNADSSVTVNQTSSSSSSSSFGATTTSFSIFESNKLAVGYSDGVIRIWDSRNNRAPLMACANHQKSQKDVTSVQWNPHDKDVLASGGEDGNVVWVDVAKQHVMFVHYGHPSGVNEMCWCWQDVFAGLMVSVDDHGVIAWSPRGYLLE